MNHFPIKTPSEPTKSKHNWRPIVKLALACGVIYLIFVTIISVIHPYLRASQQTPQERQATAASISAAEAAAARLVDRSKNGWHYTFSDFENGLLPSEDWNFEVGTTVADYNNEAQAYTDRMENVRVEDGELIIQAKREDLYNRSYTSARINTLDKFEFTHGTLEVEMMLPRGAGTWPAAWLMPSQNRYDPADFNISPNDEHSWVLNGEIDFMEAIGSIPGENIPSAHTYSQIKKSTLYTPGHVANPYDQFHTYGVIKTPGKIVFTIDGVPFAHREKTSDDPRDWPFEQPYYLILNLALGGDWAGTNGIDDTMSPWTMRVKSIHYTPLP